MNEDERGEKKMLNKRSFMLVLVVIVMVTVFTGCAKVVSEETFTSSVIIVDVDYDPAITIPMKSGNVTIMQTRPADYDVTVEYAGVEYNVDGASDYRLAKDNVGSSMLAKIVKTRYEDGTVKFRVTELVDAE